MAEDAPQAPVEDTPAPVDTPQGTDAPVEDWKKRYDDLQPAYTRATQELAQRERLIEALKSDDADARTQAAQALGLQFVEEEEEEGFEDPTEQLAAEVAAIKAQMESQNQQARQQQLVEQMTATAERELDALPDLDEQDKDWIFRSAIVLPRTSEGNLDIQGAHEQFREWEQARQKRWASSKRAPHVPANGQEGVQTVDRSTREGRVAYAMSRLQADQ